MERSGVAYHMSGLMDMDVEIDIPGKFSVYNSMTAISICRHFGVTERSYTQTRFQKSELKAGLR